MKCRLDAATLDFLGLEEFVPVNLMELLFSFFGRKPHYTEMKLCMETVIMPVYELPSKTVVDFHYFLCSLVTLENG